MKIRMGLAILGVSALAAPTAFAAPAKDADTPANPPVACENTAGPTGDTITFGGSDYLWPPNHKYRPVSVTATSGGGATGLQNTVELTTAITHNQYADEVARTGEDNGTGNTDDDATPFVIPADYAERSNTNAHQIRGERAGGDKAGRTYTITAAARFGTREETTGVFLVDSTRNCSASFTVYVPHDQSGKTTTSKKRRALLRRR